MPAKEYAICIKQFVDVGESGVTFPVQKGMKLCRYPKNIQELEDAGFVRPLTEVIVEYASDLGVGLITTDEKIISVAKKYNVYTQPRASGGLNNEPVDPEPSNDETKGQKGKKG